MLPNKQARSAALLFPAMRGTEHKLERSDLEGACEAEGASIIPATSKVPSQ
jgi:hypothetical protein